MGGTAGGTKYKGTKRRMMGKMAEQQGQLSLFDIELPPQNSPVIVQEQPEIQTEQAIEKVNFARVPDEECNRQRVKVPIVQEILKMIERGAYKVNAHNLLSDIFECGAIAISNRFDRRQAKEREERYLQIIKKYEPDMQKLIAEIFGQIYALLTNQIDAGFNDYLGQLFMQSETSNKHTGQFFTPYSISKMCAKVSIDSSTVNEHMEADKILTLSEPACGAGGMIIAAADVLYNEYHFNISRNLLVECSDIDSRCVHMTYLQLGLAGIPAIIYRRDTLTMKTWERWETPSFILQYMRFRGVLQ